MPDLANASVVPLIEPIVLAFSDDAIYSRGPTEGFLRAGTFWELRALKVISEHSFTKPIF